MYIQQLMLCLFGLLFLSLTKKSINFVSRMFLMLHYDLIFESEIKKKPNGKKEKLIMLTNLLFHKNFREIQVFCLRFINNKSGGLFGPSFPIRSDHGVSRQSRWSFGFFFLLKIHVNNILSMATSFVSMYLYCCSLLFCLSNFCPQGFHKNKPAIEPRCPLCYESSSCCVLRLAKNVPNIK